MQQMFQKTERILELEGQVYALVAPLRRGETVTHDRIAKVLGCRPHQDSWDHVIQGVRRRLHEERGVELLPNPGVGYRLALVDEQLQLPLDRLVRAARQVDRGHRTVRSLVADDLNPRQAAIRMTMMGLASEAAAKLRDERRSSAILFRPTATMPRHPDAVAANA